MEVSIPIWMVQWAVLIALGACLSLASVAVAYALLLWSTRAAKKAIATYDVYVIQWWMQLLRDRGWSIPTKARMEKLERDRDSGDLEGGGTQKVQPN